MAIGATVPNWTPMSGATIMVVGFTMIPNITTRMRLAIIPATVTRLRLAMTSHLTMPPFPQLNRTHIITPLSPDEALALPTLLEIARSRKRRYRAIIFLRALGNALLKVQAGDWSPLEATSMRIPATEDAESFAIGGEGGVACRWTVGMAWSGLKGQVVSLLGCD